MTPQPDSDRSKEEAVRPRTARDVARSLAERMKKERLTPGEIASLRRADNEEADFGGVFWKIVAEDLEPHGHVPAGDRFADRDLHRWRFVLATIARVYERHDSARRLGPALAAAGVSEMRLQRLLRADGEALRETLRAITHQLISAGEDVDVGEITSLLLSTDSDYGERVRHRIARGYYSHLHRIATSKS